MVAGFKEDQNDKQERATGVRKTVGLGEERDR